MRWGVGTPRAEGPPPWAGHPPGSGHPIPGTEPAGGRCGGKGAAHHRLLDLVIDGHHTGSGGAGRERRGRGSAPNTSLAHGSVHRHTSPTPVHRGVPVPTGIHQFRHRPRSCFAPGAAAPFAEQQCSSSSPMGLAAPPPPGIRALPPDLCGGAAPTCCRASRRPHPPRAGRRRKR